MFNIARVKFLQSSGQPMTPSVNKLYDYRIPAHLDGAVKVGDLAVVSWKGKGDVNPSLGKVEEVCNVLDGEYNADASYAYLVGVVDVSRHEALLASEKRRERLKQLIKVERKRVAETLELETLLGLSPTLKNMVEELKRLDRNEQADTFADAVGAELGRVVGDGFAIDLDLPEGYSVRKTDDGWFEPVSPEGATSPQCPTAREAASLCWEHKKTAIDKAA